MLVEADEWAQVVMMDVLGRYARVMLEKPKVRLPFLRPFFPIRAATYLFSGW